MCANGLRTLPDNIHRRHVLVRHHDKNGRRCYGCVATWSAVQEVQQKEQNTETDMIDIFFTRDCNITALNIYSSD